MVRSPIGKEQDEDDKQEEHDSKPNSLKTNTKEIRLDGCNYDVSKQQIKTWMEMYGSIESEIKEEAKINEENMTGTGSYVFSLKLNRLIPKFIPMHGLRVKASYLGVKKQCSNCYGYHKNKSEVDKVRFD